MRFGLVILPEYRWRDAAGMWRRAEELGFDHAWTYDHLSWGGLPDSPWYGTTPTLAAAAAVTERIRLGTFVASPNFRHPYAFHRDLQALDDISGGRMLLGLGSGGDPDTTILGGPSLGGREKVDRLAEFVGLLHEVRTRDHVTHEGRWFATSDARTLPIAGDDAVPLVLAANGRRSMRLAARWGRGWVTTGPGSADGPQAWWDGVRRRVRWLDEALAEAGRAAEPFDRYLSLDASVTFSLGSVDAFEDAAGRAAELGFTDVVVHRPRDDDPYRGRIETLERVARDVLPRLRDGGETAAP